MASEERIPVVAVAATAAAKPNSMVSQSPNRDASLDGKEADINNVERSPSNTAERVDGHPVIRNGKQPRPRLRHFCKS